MRHKNVTTESVDKILEKVEAHFGRLQCHLVIGANNYSANEKHVIGVIKSGTHFDENSVFLSYLYKELAEKGYNEGDKGSEAAVRLRSSSVVSGLSGLSGHSERRKQDGEESRRTTEKSSERSNHSSEKKGRNRSPDSRRDKSKSPKPRRQRSSSRRRRQSRSRDGRRKKGSRSPRRRSSSRSRERGQRKPTLATEKSRNWESRQMVAKRQGKLAGKYASKCSKTLKSAQS